MFKRLFITLLLFVSVSIFSEEYIVATAEWSPYAMKTDKEILGISVDILKEVFILTGDTYTIKLLPVERLNKLFDDNKIDINFADSPLWNDPSNGNYLFTVSYSNVDEYIYFKKDKFIDVKTPDDLKGKKVGIVRGYYYEVFENNFNNNLLIKDESNTNEALFQKLNWGRIDCAFFDTVLFDYLIKTEKANVDDFKRGVVLTNSPLGFKIRIEKKNSVEKFNKAIEKLKRDGVVDRIIKKYTK